MFQAIEIENFQCHEDTSLEFSPGVCLLTGETDKGKSAILRAIYWLTRSIPAGHEFINWHSKNKTATVTLINDHHTIQRTISKKINTYQLDDLKSQFTGFGKHRVPEEIQQALRLGDLNFQRQRDTFFLLNKSAPELGRYLNNIVHLDVIDSSLSHSRKRVFHTTQDREALQNTITQQKKSIEQYGWVDPANAELGKLELIHKLTNKKQEDQSKINALVHAYQQQTHQQKKLIRVFDYDNELKKLEKQNSYIDQLIKKANQLDRLILDFKKQEKEKKNAKKLIQFIPQITELEKAYRALQKLKQKQTSVQKLVNQIDQTRISKFRYEGIIEKLEATFAEIFPDICPLCLHSPE